MRTCIFAVQGPLHFIAGKIAKEWHETLKHPGEETKNILVLYDFLSTPALEQTLVSAIMRLSTISKWDKVVFINGQEMRRISCQHYSQSVKDLKRIIGVEEIDAIYICRETYGFGSALILNAYPRAERIMYGDSFGMAGQEVKYKWTWGKESVYIIKHFLRELIWGKPRKLSFNAAVLSLPLDWSGSYLDKVPLIVPSKKHVSDSIAQFVLHLPELNDYCQSLLEGRMNPCLFLLDTLSASGLMSRENELILYTSMVRRMAQKGETILIKNHFRNPSYVLEDLVNALKDEYTIKAIDHSLLSSMPIELWQALIKECRIVPVLSFSALSLKYIYDKDVTFVLNDRNIDEYIYPEHIAHLKNQRQALLDCIKALKDWDGRSVLWKNLEGNKK